MLELCTSAEDFDAVVGPELAMKFPEGIKVEDYSSMFFLDFNFWYAIKIVHSKYFKGNFDQKIKKLLDPQIGKNNIMPNTAPRSNA
jgi:hypothetical protein